MSGSGVRPQGAEGSVQGILYHWHFHRRRRTHVGASEQPLDRYKWRTSARPDPRSAGTSEGNEPAVEPSHRRLLGLPRFGTLPNPKRRSAEPGALQRTFLRSMSEPGTDNNPGTVPLRKVESDADRRAPSVSSFFSSLSRRISRVLREEGGGGDGGAGAEDGRGVCSFLS